MIDSSTRTFVARAKAFARALCQKTCLGVVRARSTSLFESWSIFMKKDQSKNMNNYAKYEELK